MIMYLRERYELLDHGHYWLSETPDEVSQGWDGRCRRVTVWARLRDRATGREFCLFDTHLDHIGKTARLEGARLNVERMRSIAGKRTPQFIVGDMNATAGTPGGVCLEPYFKWLKSACEEAPQTDPRPTYHGFGKAKPLHIDHIFYRCAEPLRYQLLDSTGYGVQYLSDHYPIVCTFRF